MSILKTVFKKCPYCLSDLNSRFSTTCPKCGHLINGTYEREAKAAKLAQKEQRKRETAQEEENKRAQQLLRDSTTNNNLGGSHIKQGLSFSRQLSREDKIRQVSENQNYIRPLSEEHIRSYIKSLELGWWITTTIMNARSHQFKNFIGITEEEEFIVALMFAIDINEDMMFVDLLCTNRRLYILDREVLNGSQKRKVISFDLRSIEEISFKKSIIFSTIKIREIENGVIWTIKSPSSATLSLIPFEDFFNKVRFAYDNYEKLNLTLADLDEQESASATTIPINSNDNIFLLEKYAALFEKGLLTKEEFDQKKKELL
jgi:uncharacterized Zn finger protein (UPF0148 family)